MFNPLSVFFCHGRDGALRAVLYEVNNTFGQRHSYLIPIDDAHQPVHRQHCAKRFYVSPFMEMAMRYHFRLIPAGPDAGRQSASTVHDATGPVLSACFAGRRQALTDATLLRGLLRHPMMAAQVLGGIHWEALKLWRKGMRARPRPAPPADPVSIVLPGAGGMSADSCPRRARCGAAAPRPGALLLAACCAGCAAAR